MEVHPEGKLYEIAEDGSWKMFKNTSIYRRIEVPSFDNPYVKQLWQREEMEKCRHGDGIVPGKFYFWYNYCVIQGNKKGAQRPMFKVWQVLWYAMLEWCRDNGKGLICVKRRRAGASWLMAADALHDALFNKNVTIGMNSKTESDGELLFQKVKFLYSNLPDFLRARSTAGNSSSHIHFGYYEKDINGSSVIKGKNSTILVRAPVPTAFEGTMLTKWIADEAGKTDKLKDLYDMTLPALADESGIDMVGVPVIFGTAGEMSQGGDKFKELWHASAAYNLVKFFVSGTMGIINDDYGNDLEEEAIKKVMHLREQAKQKNDKGVSYIRTCQQYPLSPEEAFYEIEGDCMYDKESLLARISHIENYPPAKLSGYFVMTTDRPVFVTKESGMVTIFEKPIDGHEYIAGTDPTDTDFTGSRESRCSTLIMDCTKGGGPPKIVAQILFKPGFLNDYFEQTALLCTYYNNCMNLIESNRGGRMIDYYKTRGYGNLLKLEPLKAGSVRRTGGLKYGYHKTTTLATTSLEPLCKEYVRDHLEEIDSIDLLLDLAHNHGMRNADIASSFEALLYHLYSITRSQMFVNGSRKKFTPTQYEMKNGNIVWKK